MSDEVAGIYSSSMPDKDPYRGVNAALDLQNKLTGTERNTVGLEKEKLGLALQQVTQLSSMMSDLMANPKAGREDMTKEINERATRGAKLGLFTPAQVVEGLKGLPADPRQQFQWLTTHHAATTSAAEKLQNMIGPASTEGVGPGSVTTQVPGYPGLPVRTRKSQEYGLPPTQERVETDGVNRGQKGPIGSPTLQMPQPGPDSLPGGFPSAPQAAPAQPLQPGQRLTPQGTSTPPVASAARPATPPARPVVSALPPGVTGELDRGSALFTDASAAAGKYGQRVNPLRTVIPILGKMKETDIGPTSERLNDIKSTLQTLGAGKLLGIDPEKIKDYAEAKKYFNQYTAQAAATLGPKTNEGLATAVTSNPNVNMDKLSATDLSKVALGVERMQQAGVLEFMEQYEAGKVNPGDFGRWLVRWATTQDPRAYVYDIMDDKGQEKIRKLPDAERAKVRDAMKIAKKHGLLGDVHRGE